MIFFRADANHNIGMGHIMRCLSIADALTNIGHDITFLLADDTACSIVESRGYKAVVLYTDYTAMDDELDSWPGTVPDIIIVDSYYITESYLNTIHEKMKQSGGKLVYIDDLASFPYPVDILVNYNAYAMSLDYRALYSMYNVKIPKLILGPAYAPLRLMFRNIEKITQPKVVENVLISTGGSDELHLTMALIQYLLEHGTKEHHFHFLLGAMNVDKEMIRTLMVDQDNIIIHENVVDMRSLIQSCDLAVSAAGSTLYEICACGTPLITYSLADNQIPGAEAFDKLGLGMSIGDMRDPVTINPSLVMSGKLRENAAERLFAAINDLSSNYEKRSEMGKRMQEMIDGFGADRMAKEILGFDLKL